MNILLIKSNNYASACAQKLQDYRHPGNITLQLQLYSINYNGLVQSNLQ